MRFGLSSEQEKSLLSQKKAGDALRILKFIAGRKKGATCDECIEATGILGSSAATRLHELELAGCVTRTGERRTTTAGRSAAVYVKVEDAKFSNYLTLPRIRQSKPGLTIEDSVVLGAGQDFVRSWQVSKTPESRKKAVVKLVDALRSVASRKS